MACAATVEVLFERAIAAERAAEALYRGLEAKFAAHEDVVAFWHSYAEDEVGHAKWLERFRDGLTPEELDAPADCIMLDNARRAWRLPSTGSWPRCMTWRCLRVGQ